MELWPTGRLLSTAARLVEHAWNDQLASIGVTHAGVIALEVLAGHGTMTQAQLAQIVRVQAQTMGKTLSRLETYGHVGRVRSTEDRRSHQVSITDHGRSVLVAAQELEKALVPGGQLSSDELRGKLQAVIKTLADSRWEVRPDTAAARALNPTETPELDAETQARVAEQLAETIESATPNDTSSNGQVQDDAERGR